MIFDILGGSNLILELSQNSPSSFQNVVGIFFNKIESWTVVGNIENTKNTDHFLKRKLCDNCFKIQT